MHVLFVHGMGRSSVSGWPMLRQFKKAGLKTSTFDYVVSIQRFDQIAARLALQISSLTAQDEVVLIGHSLGGVLLRAAINALPEGARPPQALFLLGSPMHSAQLARRLGRSRVYRLLTGDCGQLLASPPRMAAVSSAPIPTMGFVGINGPRGKLSPFGDELNDGVVSVTEVAADWMQDCVQVSILHTLMPSSRQIAQMILQKLAQQQPCA